MQLMTDLALSTKNLCLRSDAVPTLATLPQRRITMFFKAMSSRRHACATRLSYPGLGHRATQGEEKLSLFRRVLAICCFLRNLCGILNHSVLHMAFIVACNGMKSETNRHYTGLELAAVANQREPWMKGPTLIDRAAAVVQATATPLAHGVTTKKDQVLTRGPV